MRSSGEGLGILPGLVAMIVFGVLLLAYTGFIGWVEAGAPLPW